LLVLADSLGRAGFVGRPGMFRVGYVGTPQVNIVFREAGNLLSGD